MAERDFISTFIPTGADCATFILKFCGKTKLDQVLMALDVTFGLSLTFHGPRSVFGGWIAEIFVVWRYIVHFYLHFCFFCNLRWQKIKQLSVALTLSNQ